MSASTHRTVILNLLREAFPQALPPSVLEAITPKYQARVDELKLLGWNVETHLDMEHGRAGYALASLEQGPPDCVLAGCTLRVGTRAGVESRTHAEARKGPVPVAVLMEAEQAALDAYLAVVGEHLPDQSACADQIKLVSGMPEAEISRSAKVIDLDTWLDELFETAS